MGMCVPPGLSYRIHPIRPILTGHRSPDHPPPESAPPESAPPESPTAVLIKTIRHPPSIDWHSPLPLHNSGHSGHSGHSAHPSPPPLPSHPLIEFNQQNQLLPFPI